MSSYLFLELDTTPPVVEILSPLYTSPDIFTNIVIEANEVLSLYQEIYLIDSLGTRHDLTFEHDENRFNGILVLNNIPIGMITFYCRVRDDVDNMSGLISKTMNIVDGEKLIVSVDAFCAEVRLSQENMLLDMKATQGIVEVKVFD